MSKNVEDDINVSFNDSQFVNSQFDCKNCDNDEIQLIPNRNLVNKNNDVNNKFSAPEKECVENEESCKIAGNLCLSSWGLPENVLVKYKERGISKMFPWQVECLGNNNVLENSSNLVYSAPTSAGKTLVAEILALKTLLERQKKVVVILPFVSVVREKMFYFQDILALSGIRVEGFMGSHNPPGGFKAVHLAICTIEKANGIINRLMEEGSLDQLGAVVIDEMHLLGDPHRGYLLELLLTKLRYMSLRANSINIQLIGMSATLSNLDLISKWLNAEMYTTTFRPVPLQEFCLVAGELYNSRFQLLKSLKPFPDLKEDTDNILQLCLETINSSCSVLIFCPTKNWCENLAQQISVAFWKLGNSKSDFGRCLREQLNGGEISEVLEQLKRCPVGLDAVLKKTVSFGVAFHHAGLTMDERDIIEGAFRNGALRVLVATSTLSSGVNLPAQRVIIRTPLFHGKPLDVLTYRQMTGRAGRMGRDSSGESILVCQKNDKRVAEVLMGSKLYPIESCLEGAGRLKRAILEVIASGVAATPEDITLFTNCTLLSASLDGNVSVNNPIDQAINFLVGNEFIRLQKNEENQLQYVATSLAKACLSSSLPPEDGLILLEEIEKARQCFVLNTDLHLLYLVTPYSVCNQWSSLDWMLYLDIWEKLPPSMKRVGDLVGVQEAYIFNATRGRINSNTSKAFHRLQIHRRFYTALALQDLVNETPLNDVAEKFKCSRGMLQSLQQSASMFAGMVTSFCSHLGWKNVEILVSQFQDRLQFGIQHDLLDLMKLPNLNGPRARTLFSAGIETLSDLASVDECKLENILISSVPFESEKERDGETLHDVKEKRKLRSIWITGKQGLTAREAAFMLIKDARTYLQLEIGAAVMKWDSEDSSSTDSSNPLSHDSNSSFGISKPGFQNTNSGPSNTDSCNSNSCTSNSNSGNSNPRCNNSDSSSNCVDCANSNRQKGNLLHNVKKDEISKHNLNVNSFQKQNSKMLENTSSYCKLEKNINIKSCKNTLYSEPETANKCALNIKPKNSFEKEVANEVPVLPKNNVKTVKIIADKVPLLKSVDKEVKRTSICNYECLKLAVVNKDINLLNSTNNNKSVEINKDKIKNLNLISNNEENSKTTKSVELNVPKETEIVKMSKENIFKNEKSSFFQNGVSDINENMNFINNDKRNRNNIESDKLNVFEEVKITKMANENIVKNEENSFSQNGMSDLNENINLISSEKGNKKNTGFDELNVFEEAETSKMPDEIIVKSEESLFFQNGVSNLNGNTSFQSAVSNLNENSSFSEIFELNKTSNVQNEMSANVDRKNKNINTNGTENNFEIDNISDCSWTALDCEIPSYSENFRKSVSPKRTSISSIRLSNNSMNVSNKSGSLFEESICLDSKLCNALDSSLNYNSSAAENISDLNIKFCNVLNSAENNTSVFENNKEKEISLSENVENDANIFDVVDTSQTDITDTSELHSYSHSIKKTRQLQIKTPRKRNWSGNSQDLLEVFSDSFTDVTTPKKKYKCHKEEKTEQHSEINLGSIQETGPELPVDLTCFNVVDICENKSLFETFCEELKKEAVISLAVACEQINQKRVLIGQQIVKPSSFKEDLTDSAQKKIATEDRLIVGASICCGGNSVFFMSFVNEVHIANSDKVNFLRTLLENRSLNVRVFDYKEQAKVLYSSCNIFPNCQVEDPKVADWLLEPEGKEKNLQAMALKYAPEAVGVAQLAGSCKGVGSIALDLQNAVLSRIRASVEALVTWHILESQKDALLEQNARLIDTFVTEMSSISCLARMELVGFRVDTGRMNKLLSVIQEQMAHLQQRAFSLAGRHFSFISSKDVAKVLGIYRGKRVSTNKQTLEQNNHPISKLILQWRKLNCTLTKMLFPMMRSLKDDRIHGCCVTNSATGRISMHEPNLQNVPRNFDIIKPDGSTVPLSVRASFVPAEGKVFLSADYCQLELRILAHLSQDSVLCGIMWSDGDIFKSIAAKINKISEIEVTDELRQRAKQLCYGIIYGMGTKALAEQLDVPEDEAFRFMDSFKNTYPKINAFIQKTIDQCKENGYIETLSGRRRYLPNIHSEDTVAKCQAERQAVNTTIQGSAADIAKTAMVLVDACLCKSVPQEKSKVNLVLHLHDELLYEMPRDHLKESAAVIKNIMESSVVLSIPFPVKLKSGPSWGELEELCL